MATVLTDITVERSPQERRTVTDISTTPPRSRSRYTALLESLFGQAPSLRLALGAGRVAFGLAPTDEARERLFSDDLSATANRETPTRKFIGSLLRLTRPTFRPFEREIRDERARVILRSIPLDLSRKEIKLEQEEIALATKERILPFIEELKSSRVDLDRSLAEKRRTEAAVLLDLAASAREKNLADAAFNQARARQERLNRDLVETALGGLDGFSKMIFLRDRLFPPPPEPPRVGRPGRRRRVITSF